MAKSNERVSSDEESSEFTSHRYAQQQVTTKRRVLALTMVLKTKTAGVAFFSGWQCGEFRDCCCIQNRPFYSSLTAADLNQAVKYS